jgi:tetratricopeptide (TPR) repeat protein
MRWFTRALAAILIIVLSLTEFTTVDSSSATTYTRTIDRKFNFVITQDAYLPDQTVLNLGLDSPNDMHMDDQNNLYIADTGNRRIVVYSTSFGQVINEIIYDEFVSPKGVFITEDDDLYIADPGAEAIFQFDLLGNYIGKYGKPESVSLENKPFNPAKVAVDSNDNMYVIGEGIFDGIIQMSSEGEFLGYFANNKVVLSAAETFQNLIFSDNQLEQLSNRDPSPFTNVYVPKGGLPISTSVGDDISNLQKHNTNGSSSIDVKWGIDLGLIDVYTDDLGIIYTASEFGYIDIFTPDGQFIFSFGTSEDGVDISGLYSQLISITVDSNGKVWTLDNDKAFIQSYTPTDYSKQIYQALDFYNNGEYQLAVDSWEEVLKLNQLSVLAHNELGRNLFSQGHYQESLKHFELSGNRLYYSEAYWEVRNVQIQQTLPFVLLGIIGFVIVYNIIKLTNKKYSFLTGPKEKLERFLSIKPIADFLFQFSFWRHPIDGFYELKRKKRGSYLMATIILLLFFLIYMNYTINKGYIFQFVEASDMDLGAIVLGFFSVFVLFIFSNYLVTSINDGEGSIGDIYKGVMYSLSPLMVSYVLVSYLSFYVTYNELILLQILDVSGMIGTAIILFLAVSELHNYTIRETIKSFLLTFLFMVIAGVLFAFIQIMGDQLIQFILGLFGEAFRNVIY